MKKIKKSKIMLLFTFFILIPLTLFWGSRLSGRTYYLTSTLVIIEIMIPFLLAFEGRRPQARELVAIAVMASIAVAARVLIPLPNFKMIFAIIMISGIAFGSETGFMVGAIAAFASNFFYGQGMYTPWQMFAYGAGGMVAGFAFAKKRLPRNRVVMGIFGFAAVVLLIGPLLDTSSIFLMLPVISWDTVWPLYLSGLSVNLIQGICTFVSMVILAKPLLEKLERVKIQYGMMEEENGL